MMLRRMAKNQQKTPKQNNALGAVRKKVIIQAVIALQTIIITIALVFGMSAAWYTNVLQTSGLQFEAAAWGFTGQVLVSQEAIQASPGDSGIIGLRVTNTGDDLVNVAVHVSKAQMVSQMQQRLFFYVDAAATRNGEAMQRVYINTQDSYTYSVLSQSELVLTKEYANDSVLKWQWVYDMLGYYFVGTVSTTTDAAGSTITDVKVDDYLRPVEYDLDTATFTDGVLTAVDNGSMTVMQFLAQLSASDGYAGSITASSYPGYYQVSVDNSGYGIWVYLCNWAEIQQATTYDSQLGKAAADALLNGDTTVLDSYIARLTVVGQTMQAEYTEVTTVEQLTTALNAGEMVQLRQNLTLDQVLTLKSGKNTVLDLNGYTITGAEGSSVLQLSDATNLIVMNGDIVATDSSKDVISVSGSSLTLSKVNISGEGDDAIDIVDQGGSIDSTVRLFDCTIEVAGCAVFVRGNGSAADGSTQVVVEGCTLTSGYITIMGNGSSGNWGTDVQIYQSKLTGYYAAIYQPQGDSVTRVIESTASGMTGIALKGGDLYVVDSTVTGTGEKAAPKLESNGYTDTGDAIYVDCSYEKAIYVSISGKDSNIASENSYAVQVFVPEGYQNLSTVEITGGTYSSDVSAFVPELYAYDSTTRKVSAVGGAEDEE